MSTLREKFTRELQIRGRSERTVHAYIASVKALAVYYNKPPDGIDDEAIRDWLRHLVVGQRLCGSSVNCAVQAVRTFQQWVLGRERADTVRGVPRGKRATTRAEVYALAEIAAILAAAPAGRDRTFLTVVYACGLRLDEARHLQTGDLDAARGQLRARRGKGNKARVLPLPAAQPSPARPRDRDRRRTRRSGAVARGETHRVSVSPRHDGCPLPWQVSRRAQRVEGRRGRAGTAGRLAETLEKDREFLRRFRTHLLPHRFTKIRHYGLLANAARARLVPLARAALVALGPAKTPCAAGRKKAAGATPPPAEAGPWPPPCAHCGGTRVSFLGLTLPGATVVAGHSLAPAGPVCAGNVRVPP